MGARLKSICFFLQFHIFLPQLVLRLVCTGTYNTTIHRRQRHLQGQAKSLAV